nr:uncharacterized protein LOC4346053 isoform X2 [Oryza sativa Japonica Group]
MKELYAGSNDRYKGLEARLDELHGHMDELKKSLRVSYTALHQTATSLGEVEAPAFGDETSMTAALAELVTVLESVVPKYTSQMRETATTGVRIGAAHILACFRANYPELDLENILRHGEANSGHLQFAEEVAPIADSILPFYQGVNVSTDVSVVEHRDSSTSPHSPVRDPGAIDRDDERVVDSTSHSPSDLLDMLAELERLVPIPLG